MTFEIILGDALDELPKLRPKSADAIVTDPPYGLKFMGKAWDRGVPGIPFWIAAFEVAKPGAYMVAFGGTRTFHRLTCAIEDAGFEIHDAISWLYGSGFPKHASKLKPGWEPIILARRPAPRATPLNIDACRLTVTDAGLDGRAEKPLLWSAGTQSPGTFQSPNTHRAAQNHHPTVKPLALMQWLCRLVTPKGGTVLDPFCGSGSTGRAAVAEGFSFVGIDNDPEYVAIARARIADYAPLFTPEAA